MELEKLAEELYLAFHAAERESKARSTQNHENYITVANGTELRFHDVPGSIREIWYKVARIAKAERG